MVKRDPLAGLADDVRKGLSAQPKRFLPKYFYDELGSQLFEAICLLPEYYLTRAENEILQRYSDEIVASVDGQKTLVEMGSGSASKTRLVIEALLRIQPELLFMPVDISATALESSSRILLQSYPRLRIEAYAADYFAGLAELGKKPR
ncbi:MAG TPA: L-histidine N(alpha)-methyltransferase, partial [Pyrinomonadaceae bacterium]